MMMLKMVTSMMRMRKWDLSPSGDYDHGDGHDDDNDGDLMMTMVIIMILMTDEDGVWGPGSKWGCHSSRR